MWFELIPAPRPEDDADDKGLFQRRAKAAADAIGLSSRPGWLDWWRHDDGCRLVVAGEHRWLEVSDRYGQPAAERFARAAGATARRCGEPDALGRPRVWAHAFVPRSATLARNARDEAPDADQARLDPADDVVVVLNVRRLGWIESARNSDWLGDEYNMQADISKLRGEGLGVCRVMAGAGDARTAMDQAKNAGNSLNLGLVPGLSAHVSRPGLGLALAALAVEALLALPALLWPGAPLWMLLAPFVWAAPMLAALVRWWLKRDSANDVDQRPRHWWAPFARTRMARASDLKTRSAGDDGDAGSKTRVHAYAYQRSTLPLPCGALVAVAAPPARRTASVAALTVMPDALKGMDGPILGVDAEGTSVRMSPDALYGGVFLMGEPGGGKSNMMHGLTGWAAKRHGTGDVLVDFESKGVDSIPILKRMVPRLLVVDVNDDASPMIDLLGAGSPHERAERFAGLMQAALGVQQIGPQSRFLLRDAVEVALLALGSPDWERRCHAAGVEPAGDWAGLAARLLARNGVADARALGRAARMATDSPDVAAAVERLHGGVTETGRPKLRDGEVVAVLRAPMNKMDLLASAPWLTAPGRRRLTWAAIVARSGAHPDARVAVNLGAALPVGADGRHRDMPDGVRRLVGALLFRGLKDEIVASCSGWQERGRRMRVTVDELTDVLGADDDGRGGNADILSWLREKGRAYGVELTVGTQNAMQLQGELLASVTSLMTVGSFVLRADLTAGPSAQAIGSEAAVVKGLPMHTILVRTVGPPPEVAGLPPMVLKVPHFDAGAGV
ncbi:hypothetical protein [Bifidobacterium myosotis]|uniref:Uncharacterized protein n=1 Tax=Bifidobacterium myosotis TaxID=1630166 RepID=A0A5M9ZHL8_9BIFI|nr:hypothetical protein [Bifidobacterium myosotis]KAA8826998.1 hypothetical protein EMO91_10750 [Bifidobacterium myosotis]